MKNEELQTFAKLIQPLRTDQLKPLLFALLIAAHYKIPIYSTIREIKKGMKEEEFNEEPGMYHLAPIPVAFEDFFDDIGWHKEPHKKLIKQAIQLVINESAKHFVEIPGLKTEV